MTRRIAAIEALEILDSRGVPTVQAMVVLDDGLAASASVPSGTSTGSNEAVELRDGDPARHRGRGVQRAVANVESVIAPTLRAIDVTDPEHIARALIDLDGTPDKSRLGANATLAVSQARTRASAHGRRRQIERELGPRASFAGRGT